MTLENTVKLLIRCKILFHARDMLVQVLSEIVEYEIRACDLKENISKKEDYVVSQVEKLRL